MEPFKSSPFNSSVIGVVCSILPSLLCTEGSPKNCPVWCASTDAITVKLAFGVLFCSLKGGGGGSFVILLCIFGF